MHLESVRIKDFRNLNNCGGEAFVKLNGGLNILCGKNAQGKTNFIEAVYFCATARSHRTNGLKELVRFGAETARLQAVVSSGGETPFCTRVDVLVKQTGRGIAVDGIPVAKLGDLLGLLYAVIFSPEDLNIIKAGPGERRRFMDMELCQTSKVYYYELKQYYKILRQRNSLLKSLRGNTKPELAETLGPWDAQLAAEGAKISAHRKAFIEKINSIAVGIHEKIAGVGESFEAVYRPNIAPEEFIAKLARTRAKDILYGTTGHGIHKDDVAFLVNGMDSRVYSSQGQQRTAALSLKLAELSLIAEEKGETPVLLMDDVLSELDAGRQQALFETVAGLGVQTIITCTGVDDILYGGGAPDTVFFTVDGGNVKES